MWRAVKEAQAMQDIRWRQRFNNYLRAFQTLVEAAELAHSRELSKLEQQGLIQSFEFTHELAWNVLKDYWNGFTLPLRVWRRNSPHFMIRKTRTHETWAN
jgi:hypothetical protein